MITSQQIFIKERNSTAIFTAILVVAVLILHSQMLSQDAVSKITARATPVRSSTRLDGWPSSDTLLTSLIEAAVNNKLPLGIVVEDQSLCRTNLLGGDTDTTVGSLVKEIERQVPAYDAEIRKGTLFIHPKTINASTLNALELVIPNFATEPSTVQAIGVSLWMYIRAALVPQQGSGFEGGMQRGAETLPGFEMTNATVQDILSRVVTSGQGGLWVMRRIPANWQSNPDSIPYQIFSYSGAHDFVKSIKCSQ